MTTSIHPSTTTSTDDPLLTPAWIFVWTTHLGRIVRGSRDVTFNGQELAYEDRRGRRAGVLWRRAGTAWPLASPAGNAVGAQGIFGSISIVRSGVVTDGFVVVSPTGALPTLAHQADRCVRSGKTSEWTLARVGLADGRTIDGVAVKHLTAVRALTGTAPACVVYRLDGGTTGPPGATEGNITVTGPAGTTATTWRYPANFADLDPPTIDATTAPTRTTTP